MTAAPWTPGPWTCHFGDDEIACDCRYVLAEYGGMGSIATIDVCQKMDSDWGDDNGPSVEVAKANARLIAAAPDLYAALEMAKLWLDVDGRFDMQGINAALAKARGQA